MKPVILFIACLFYFTTSNAQQLLLLTDSMRLAIINECCVRVHSTHVFKGSDTMDRTSEAFKKQTEGKVESNFAWLLSVTQQYGFPSPAHLKIKNNDVDSSCRIWSALSVMTVWETMLQRPEVLFEDSVVALFEREINAGRMPKNVITSPLNVYSSGHLCANDMSKINGALIRWGIDTIPRRQFYLCQ